MLKNAFLTTSSMTLALAVALPTYAQDFEDEIIVTATKREQTLQEVPVAVTVTTADTIQKAKIQDIIDLQTVVPSLRVTQLQNSVQTNFIIRGFGNGANNPGIEPSVGVFIDGVYRSRSAGALADLPNLERVEVLRGPQSTLFGKNASAGVISVVSAKPSYDPEGYIEGTIGNYDQRALKGYFSTGLGDAETVAFSLGGSINQRDGYYDNLLTNTAQNDRDRWGVRAQVLMEPSDDLSIRVIGDIDQINEVCCGVGNIVAGPTADIITGGGVLGLVFPPNSPQFSGLGANLVPNDLYAYEGYYDFDPINEVDNKGMSLHVDLDVSENIAMKSITSYREQDIFFDGDVDFTGARLVSQNTQDTNSKTFTQELRFEGGSNDFDWLVGGFYFKDNLTTDTDIRYDDQFRTYADYLTFLQQLAGFQLGGPAPDPLGAPLGGVLGLAQFLNQDPSLSFFEPGQGLQVGFEQDNEAYSLFGQVDWEIVDRLTLTGGLSFVRDEKEVSSVSGSSDVFSNLDLNFLALVAQNPAIGGLTAFQFLPPFQDFPNAVETDNTSSDSKFTYTLRGAYDVSDNINVYASASTGFKATTWNLSRDSRPVPADFTRLVSQGLNTVNLTSGSRLADPEESTVYELGVKAKLDRGYVNVTVFDQTIKGFQSNIFTGTGFILANAGKQSAQGIEFEGVYSPFDGLDVSASATLMDPIYDSFDGGVLPRGELVQADGTPGLTGLKPAGIHELSAVLGATYTANIGDREAYIRGDYLYESKVRVVDGIDELDVGDAAFRKVSTVNLSAGIDITDALGLQVWGRNVLNDEYPLSIFPSVAQAGSFSGYPSAPRTYGASIRYDFD